MRRLGSRCRHRGRRAFGILHGHGDRAAVGDDSGADGRDRRPRLDVAGGPAPAAAPRVTAIRPRGPRRRCDLAAGLRRIMGGAPFQPLALRLRRVDLEAEIPVGAVEGDEGASL